MGLWQDVLAVLDTARAQPARHTACWRCGAAEAPNVVTGLCTRCEVEDVVEQQRYDPPSPGWTSAAGWVRGHP
jgi:hypothetical protein